MTPEASEICLRSKIAVFAGRGILPELLANRLEKAGASPRYLALDGCVPGWLTGREHTLVTFTDFLPKFADHFKDGCRTAVFAGSIGRPRIADGSSGLAIDIESGDDAAIRKFVGIIEDIGFRIVGSHEFLPELLAGPGILSRSRPDEAAQRDTSIAARIVRALGAVDVGQAAVVAQGVCLGVEAVEGTDHLIRSSGLAKRLLPRPEIRSGVLYKAPKPQQELRLDFPVIGPDTPAGVARAGLAGIAFEANGVMILDRAKTVELADEAGIFIWSRDSET